MTNNQPQHNDHQLSQHVALSTINELPVLKIQNQQASACIAIQGAHLIEYTPTNKANVLFVSNEEPYIKGKAIRGGIPICWPWFGAHETLSDVPAHGFVRDKDWQYEIVSDSLERTDIRFSFTTEGEQAGFAYPARCELLVSIGETLLMSLTTNNTGDKPFEISQALHSYFQCADIQDVRIKGLKNSQFLDQLSDSVYELKKSFKFEQEVDGIVLDRGQPVELKGLGQSTVTLIREGSNSLVLWNPWIEKSKRLSSFDALDYLRMVCVEVTNTSEDSRLVKPGKSHTLFMEIVTEPNA